MFIQRRQQWSLQPQAIMGLILVALPVIAAILLAAKSLDETAKLGWDLNQRIYTETRTVHRVFEKISDIERKARLFVLLSDPSLRQPYERVSYEKVRTSFQQALMDLRSMSNDNEILLLANELEQKEDLIYQQLIGWDARSSPAPAVDQAFHGLREASAALSRQFDQHVEQTFQALWQQTQASKKLLLLDSGILLAISLGVLLALLVRQKRILVGRMGEINPLCTKHTGSNTAEDPGSGKSSEGLS